MKAWVLKAIVQKIISFMPYKHRLNYFFQRHVTKGAYLTDELFEDKLTHCCVHLTAFGEYAQAGKDGSLEIGTGWYPVVPIGFYLSGFSNIFSIDIAPLVSRASVIAVIERFCEYERTGRLSQFLGQINEDRLNKIRKLSTGTLDTAELMNEMGIRLLIGDASATGFQSNYFSMIHSNNTLEHIYPNLLKSIFSEFRRILHPAGIMSHNIDMSDHFSHLDKSISKFNFLKFSERQWKMIDNSIQPQNRLRINDFERMLGDSGFKIIERNDCLGSADQLRSLRLAKRFSRHSESDLVVTHSHLIAAKI